VLGDIDLVRPLALAGVRSAVVAVPGDPTRFSRFASTIAVWDNDSLNDELLEPLVAWGRAQPGRPLLYYEWDGHLLFVSRHRDRLAKAFRFVIDDHERVLTMLDKERFLALANELELPVPPARAIDPLQQSPEDLGLVPAQRGLSARVPPPGRTGELGFPFVVKPTDRTDDRWKHFEHLGKARRVADADELGRVWPTLVAYGRPVLLQQLIPGPESCIESYHVFVTPEGNVAAEFTGRKVRTTPAEYGATTACTITDARDVVAVGRDVIGRIGLRGVAKLDFKRGPDGRLYLLEVNPRFNLWHYPGAVAGVNLPALVRDYLEGRPLPPPSRLRARPGVTWCSPYDVMSAGARPAALLDRLRFAATSEAKAIWAPDDPLPLLATAALRLAGPAVGALRRARPLARA
jgi:predicted ATP-grasp superfamily ATP-dependent carboligase